MPGLDILAMTLAQGAAGEATKLVNEVANSYLTKNQVGAIITALVIVLVLGVLAGVKLIDSYRDQNTKAAKDQAENMALLINRVVHGVGSDTQDSNGIGLANVWSALRLLQETSTREQAALHESLTALQKAIQTLSDQMSSRTDAINARLNQVDERLLTIAKDAAAAKAQADQALALATRTTQTGCEQLQNHLSLLARLSGVQVQPQPEPEV